MREELIGKSDSDIFPKEEADFSTVSIGMRCKAEN
jgi:hypothetical protein